MAELCAVVGESGSGKSTSLRNLDPKSTFIVNVANKPLPIRGYKKNYIPLEQDSETKQFTGNLYNTSKSDKVLQIFKIIDKTMPHIKTIVVDDAQYLMAFEVLDRALEKGFDKFSQIAQNFYSILQAAIGLREDLKIFMLFHSENAGDALNPKYKIKTQGKMLDSVLTIEGLFTYVLFSVMKSGDNDNMEYLFMTNSDGTNTAKSPMGCFEEIYIDNDLAYVIEKINEYNE